MQSYLAKENFFSRNEIPEKNNNCREYLGYQIVIMNEFRKKPDDYLVKAESYKANNRKYQKFGSLVG